jgi:hypothetical protein
MKTFLKVLVLIAGTVAAGGSASARTDSPFYPESIANPNSSVPLVSAGSGIPEQYRLGR